MKNFLQISPLKLLLLFIEVLYFTINLWFAPYTHYNYLSTRFCFSFLSSLLSDFHPSKGSTRKQNLLVGLKIISLLSQIRYLEEIDWFDSQETLILDLAFEGLFRIFILSLLSATHFVKFFHSLSSVHISCVLLIHTQTNKNLIIRIIIQGLLFCLSLYLSHRARSHREGETTLSHSNLKTEEMMRNVLDHLCEGVILLDKQGDVKYVNNYLDNSEDNLTLQKLSNQFCNFELNDIIPRNLAKCPSINQIEKFDLSSPSRLSFPNLPLLSDSIFNSNQISSLIDVFNLYMKPSSLSFAELQKFRPTFKARFHPSQNDCKYVELEPRVIQGEENQLLILIKDQTQHDLKSLLIEKEKSIYQENFVSSLSHELRTPLNANLAFLEQAMESPLIHFDFKEKLIKPAFVSAKLLFYIISDVIDYSMILANTIKLDMKSKSIIRTVNKCLEIFYTKAIEKNIKLNLVIQGEIPAEFCTDHKRVSQVLVNLLKNAIQFTIKGTVEVVLTRISNQDIMISVRDTGIGMSQAAQERLIYNLNTEQLRDKIHENSAGIGFGMFISNKLTKLINESSSQGIKFHSELGIGSKFYFQVKNSPLACSDSPKDYFKQGNNKASEFEGKLNLNTSVFRYTTRGLKNRFNSSPTPSPCLSEKCFDQPKSRVLVVDDEVFNIIVIENFCRSLGVSVEKALNGEEAISKLKACSNDGQAPLRAIFMDINMPVKDGYQATREIQEMINNGEIERVPVIGVTAYGSKEKIEKGYNSGMVEMLNKPLSKEVIMEVLSYYKVI